MAVRRLAESFQREKSPSHLDASVIQALPPLEKGANIDAVLADQGARVFINRTQLAHPAAPFKKGGEQSMPLE